MPAISVSDLSVLPRLPAPMPGRRVRSVRTLTSAPAGYEGEGFPVKRSFAGVDLAAVDPFIHMDEMGAVEYAPGEPKGTPWHPHRGFETVTYLIDGAFEHRDSHGGGGLIANGDTQWMTAGSGLLHIERPPEQLVQAGGLFHGIQLWVNLPAVDKLTQPRYQDLRAGEVDLLSSADGGALIRVIAGELAGVAGPGRTHTPIVMLHLTVAPGARVELPWRPDFNALVYVMSGRGQVGEPAVAIGPSQLAVLGTGDSVSAVLGTGDSVSAVLGTGDSVSAVLGTGDSVVVAADQQQESRHASGLEVLVLGGAPIREPIAWAGPFVMNTESEVRQAFADARSGRLGVVPAGQG